MAVPVLMYPRLMMDDSRKAMATWLGTLARGGVLADDIEEAGVAVAAYVVGEKRLSKLREWMQEQLPHVVVREQRAVIEVLIWMANADRHLDEEEIEMLRRIVRSSELDEHQRDALMATLSDLPSLDGIEKRLTHPVLRELMLALAWELAAIDGRVERSEEDFYTGLAKRLGVAAGRAEEIRDSIAQAIR